MKVLVTGGSGFIGTNLVHHLTGLGYSVQSLDIAPPRNPHHAALWRHIDVCARGSLMHAVREFNPDVLFHLAARTDLDGAAITDYPANVAGVTNLIEAARATPSLQRVVFASSRLVCKIGYQPTHNADYCPTTSYGQSKVEGERLVRAGCAGAGFSWVILRPTSIWGPWFDVPYKLFFLSVAKGRYVHPKSVKVLKSFGFVGNTVHQLELAGRAAAGKVHGKTMYLADYPPIEVSALATEVQRATGARPVRAVPLSILRAMAWAGDAAKAMGMRNPPLTSFRLDNLLTPMVHDMAPLEQLCGPLPHSTSAGVAATVAWMRASGGLA